MKQITALIIALLSAIWAAADEIPQAYFDLMGRADSAIADGRLREAEHALLDAMALQPDNPANAMLMSNLGMVRFSLGLDSLAVATLDDACRMAPGAAVLLRNRARVLTACGLLDRAVADYTTLLEADSTATEPRFHRGMIYLKRLDIEKAGADFAVLERTAPDLPETHLGLASLAMAISDFAAAEQHYTKLIALDRRADYYAGRALCRLMTDRLAEASDDIALGLQLDPLDSDLYLYRAMLNQARYRPDDARRDAQRALELGVDAAAAAPFLN